LAAEHGELVAEHQDLQVLGGVAADQQDEQLDRAAECQVGELGQHAGSLRDGSAEASPYRAVLSELAAAQRPRPTLRILRAERGFRDLKSQLLLRPVFHRLEHRIRAHVLLCWLALLLTRVAVSTAGEY
jgi:hypothetical protein